MQQIVIESGVREKVFVAKLLMKMVESVYNYFMENINILRSETAVDLYLLESWLSEYMNERSKEMHD